MSTEIIISELQNEYDALVAEVQKLKDEIADLTAEKDDLELHICRERLNWRSLPITLR